MVDKLRKAKVGVRCGEERVPALLFADDMVILAEGEEELRRGLGVLKEWCSEWVMKVNADQMWCDAYKKKWCKENKFHFLSWW